MQDHGRRERGRPQQLPLSGASRHQVMSRRPQLIFILKQYRKQSNGYPL